MASSAVSKAYGMFRGPYRPPRTVFNSEEETKAILKNMWLGGLVELILGEVLQATSN